MKYTKTHKIYLADTDATGFVYYARYLEWMEAARVDLLEEIGVKFSDLLEGGEISAVVRSTSCNYQAPLRFGDTVEVSTFISKLAKTNVIISYEFTNLTTGQKAGTAEVAIVFIDKNSLRPTKIPENIISGFEKYLIEAAAV